MRSAVLAAALACACTPVPWIEPEIEPQDPLDDEHLPLAPEEAPPPPRSAREILDLPPPRMHALWPVPATSACPRVTFGALAPTLHGGDMVRRIEADFTARAAPSPFAVPTEAMLLSDHLGLPGVRLVAALNHSAGCMMGWWHQHCFVTARAVYCAGDAQATIARFVRDHALQPHSLGRSAWLELVTVLLGVQTIVLWPDEIGTCGQAERAWATAPSVELSDARVRVQLTGIAEGAGTQHTVEIRSDGTVVVEAKPMWSAPPDPYG